MLLSGYSFAFRSQNRPPKASAGRWYASDWWRNQR